MSPILALVIPQKSARDPSLALRMTGRGFVILSASEGSLGRLGPATLPHVAFFGRITRLAPLPVRDFLGVDAVLLNVAAEICDDILVMMYTLAAAHSYTRITHRR